MQRLLIMTTILAVCSTSPARAQKAVAADSPDSIRLKLKIPAAGKEGRLELRVPKARLISEIERAIPATTAIPDVKLGDKLIYRDVQLNKLKATGLKPKVLKFEDGVFRVEGTPEVTGDLNSLYNHVVIKMETRTVSKVLGREIKMDVPVEHSEWRPKGAAPFSVKADVRGTCKISFTAADRLDTVRLRLNTQADFVRITDVRLQSDEPLYNVLKELVAVVGRAFPNDGINKPIKDAMTRQIDIDVFQGLAAADRQQLEGLRAKDIVVTTTKDEVKVTATLIKR